MMIPTPHNRLLTSALLVLLVALALVGCGSGVQAPNVTAPIELATPTPVPTTPPLSLPLPDASLPALAPLPASAATSAPAAEAQVPGASFQDDEDPGANSVPASSQVSAQPAQAPGAVEAAGTAVLTSADQWSDCLRQVAQNTQTSVLLDPIAAGTSIDLSSVQLNALAAASAGCDVAATALADTAVGDYLSESRSCVDAWLSSSGGGSVLVGLVSIDWGQPTPAWAQAHLMDALVDCFTGVSFAADVMSVVSVDTSLAGAFDASCLATSFDASGTMRRYAQALANDPGSASLHVRLSDGWVLNCANVGQMVAVTAAADGVALSDSTVSCIDNELKDAGAVASLITGTADTDAVGIATIACLTDGEAAALLG